MNKQDNALKNTISLTVLFFLLGILIIMSVKSYASTLNQAENSNQQLVEYIEKLESDTAELEQQILAVRSEIDQIHSQQTDGETLISELNTTLNQLNTYAGLTQIQGEGIRIVIDDNTVGAELAKKANPLTYNPELYIVHYRDLLHITKALANEAEAIAINDIRLNDNYSIRCVGTVIMVNSIRLAPPYTIDIIGDTQKLMQTLQECATYHNLVRKEIPITATIIQNLYLPAAAGLSTSVYATPSSTQE